MRRVAVLVTALLFMSGCGAFQNLLDILFPPAESGSAKLVPFDSEEDMVRYFSDQVAGRNASLYDEPIFSLRNEEVALDTDGGAGEGGFDNAAPPPGEAPPAPADPPAPDPSDGAVSDEATTGDGDFFSDTTTQEEGVAEADVVKTDGTYLYIIDDAKLRIVRANPPESLASVGEVDLEGYGREIYLHDGKIVALTETYGYFFGFDVIGIEPIIDAVLAQEGGDSGAADGGGSLVPEVQRPKTIVTVIDVSTPGAPATLSVTKFEGTLSSSRMIEGILYLVVSNYQFYYADILPQLGSPSLSRDDIAVSAEALMPNFERVAADGTESGGDVVSWDEAFHPEDPDGFGMVSVISLDVDNDARFSAVGVMAEPGNIYSSRQALYLTDTDYGSFDAFRETTDIHKFAYSNGVANLVASGSVPGRVLNQYSMGEHEGFLRVATTVSGLFFDGRESSNNVYVLGQEGDALNVVGAVENIAPRETIQSARFIGDRGFVVTFEQIDPLFTLDLSVPTNPRIVGELKVPGFSTFLVPMDANHLLAVGQYIPPPGAFRSWGVQLSIFDVTDFANPTLKHQEIIGGDGGAWSEALYNPKAFTYFAQGGRVALPASIYGGPVFFDESPPVDVVETPEGEVVEGDAGMGEGGESDATEPSEPVAPPPPGDVDEPIADDAIDVFADSFEGLIVYDVSTDDGFAELQRISTIYDTFYYPWFTRGVFINDVVYAVTSLGVRCVRLDGSGAAFELAFPNAFDDQPVPFVDAAVSPLPVR